ncbi:30S ribosomal protein S13 [Sclerotinia borealis F-4128]|uniref:30S ribosomal protein S13 n=1 Tax=Sclerotinia borealis (strain F-4128) TaxID=1432307 RepID=W9CMC5_SCLBF|nr:30S ribosomal protein S13 [Sclerotinia borealis F-4128]
MVFLQGVPFVERRLVKSALESFYGLGGQSSSRIMAKYYIQPMATIGSLTTKTVLSLSAELSTMPLDEQLKRRLQDNLLRLRTMGTYRGRRHAMGLPVRGQNTRSQISSARALNKVNRRG